MNSGKNGDKPLPSVASWPPSMTAPIAAAYVGERSKATFIKRVGTIWPKPYVDTGRGKGRLRAWRKADLDKAIGLPSGGEDLPSW